MQLYAHAGGNRQGTRVTFAMCMGPRQRLPFVLPSLTHDCIDRQLYIPATRHTHQDGYSSMCTGNWFLYMVVGHAVCQ